MCQSVSQMTSLTYTSQQRINKYLSSHPHTYSIREMLMSPLCCCDVVHEPGQGGGNGQHLRSGNNLCHTQLWGFSYLSVVWAVARCCVRVECD